MPSEPSYAQLFGVFWDWVKLDANTWLRAMTSLKSVLRERDLESEETLLTALRFSAFSIAVAMLIEYAARYIFIPKSLSAAGSVALFVLYYVQTFIITCATVICAWIVRSRASMRKCFVMALFATVYWTPNNLLSLFSFSDKALYRLVTLPAVADLKDVPDGAATLAFIALPILAFVFYGLVGAAKYVFGVGVLRASIIVLGTATLQGAWQGIALRPLFEALMKSEFG